MNETNENEISYLKRVYKITEEKDSSFMEFTDFFFKINLKCTMTIHFFMIYILVRLTDCRSVSRGLSVVRIGLGTVGSCSRQRSHVAVW